MSSKTLELLINKFDGKLAINVPKITQSLDKESFQRLPWVRVELSLWVNKINFSEIIKKSKSTNQ